MSGLKIYGATQSRAFRALWAAKELGLDYEHLQADLKSADFAKVNPNAKMPAITDGKTTIFESMAINLYLARKHDKGLWPKSVDDEGLTFQWSFWVMTEVEKPLLNVLMDVIGMKKDVATMRFIRKVPGERLEPADGEATVCAVLVETDDATGLARRMEPLRLGGRLKQSLPQL